MPEAPFSYGRKKNKRTIQKNFNKGYTIAKHLLELADHFVKQLRKVNVAPDKSKGKAILFRAG